MRRLLAIPLIALSMLLFGCAGTVDGSTSTASGSQPMASETPTPTPTPATATELANAIKTQIPSITEVVTITEDNDPNNLIGRPTGYTDAAVMHDNNVSCTDLGVSCGATVEIWPDDTAAQARSDYIQGLLKDSPILGTEYHYLVGPSLLRVTGDIKPSLAAEYEAAFHSVAG